MLGVIGYFWVDHFARQAGVSDGLALTVGGLGFVPPIAASLVLGVFLARRITDRRRDAWLDELADEHGVPRERLREVGRIFD